MAGKQLIVYINRFGREMFCLPYAPAVNESKPKVGIIIVLN
jgi:hypothetical protein